VTKKCKINSKIHCGYSKCHSDCKIFQETGQRAFGAPQPEIIEVKKRKGHTVVYYRVQK
jgi:hypothetical protein